MGSYGIGPGRVMGTVVEIHHDEKGIIWPASIAPFDIHLVVLDSKHKEAEHLYGLLGEAGMDVLYDDRDKAAGEKFADADLIGIPIRIVVSSRTLEKDSVEVKRRDSKEVEIVLLAEIATRLANPRQ